MKLSQLLSIYSQLNWGSNPTAEVAGVTSDSREFKSGDIFVAVRGYSFDGHEFVAQACEGGAVAVIVEDESFVPETYTGASVVVEDTKLELQKIAHRYFDYPANQLYCVGITGTNGKTSTSYMVEQVLNEFGWATGVLGTVDHHIKDHKWESQLTTPDPLTLFKRLKEFKALGAEAVAFEVSSHALQQKRADEIPFSAAVFTNLTRDHLDYHGTIENYFSAKEKLFNELLWKSKDRQPTAIINMDDEFGRKLNVYEGAKRWSYGSKDCDFEFSNVRQSFSGIHFHLKTPRGEGEVFLPMTGEHNVYNAVAAIAVGMSAGADFEICARAMGKFTGVPGRLQKVENDKKLHIFVDYAHTDDALKNVLSSLKSIRDKSSQSSKIITVFGCGGDRDRGKRPLMMQAALWGSDQVILTSDNPRTEDPQRILDDCLDGVDNKENIISELDRKLAIQKAIQVARSEDVILVAGKGHEDYQIIGAQKLPFSDMEVIRELLGGL